MAKLEISLNPELTAEKVFGIFKNQFSSKYELYETKLIGADFVIKKTAWTGVSVKLLQKKEKTIIRYGAFAPSAAVRMLFMGLIPMLIAYFVSWKDMQKEIKDFIEKSGDLRRM